MTIKNKCCNEMGRISKYSLQHVLYLKVQLYITQEMLTYGMMKSELIIGEKYQQKTIITNILRLHIEVNEEPRDMNKFMIRPNDKCIQCC